MPEQRAIMLLLMIVMFVWTISKSWQNPVVYRLGFHQHLLSHDSISFPTASLCLDSTGGFSLFFFYVLHQYNFITLKIISPPLSKGLLLKKGSLINLNVQVFLSLLFYLSVHRLHERKSARWCNEQRDMLSLASSMRFCCLLPVFPAAYKQDR